MSDDPIRVRASIVGFGVVGEWVVRAILREGPRLRHRHGIDLAVVGLGNRRDGFVHDERGIDLEAALSLKEAGESIAGLPGVQHWPTALAGLEATDADVLVEVGQSPQSDGEPGIPHMRSALVRGIPVATSNKWPVALAGLELSAVAEDAGTRLLAESTVMSGTPVLAALTGGLGGAHPLRMRGILNATVNSICSAIADGAGYPEALEAAQAAGLAEPDPSADVDGHDSVAKVMIVSALVFGEQLSAGDVGRLGIAQLDPAELEETRAGGRRPLEIAVLDPGAGIARVGIEAVAPADPLFGIEGATNAIRVEADPLGEISVSGPGAGPELAGQGVLSDLITLARERGRSARRS